MALLEVTKLRWVAKSCPLHGISFEEFLSHLIRTVNNSFRRRKLMNGMMFFICFSFVSWKYSCNWTDVRELQTVVGYFRWLVAQKGWWFAIAEWYRNWTARGPSSGDGNEVFQTACSLGNADSNGAIRQSWRSRRVPWNSPVGCVLSSHARCTSAVSLHVSSTTLVRLAIWNM